MFKKVSFEIRNCLSERRWPFSLTHHYSWTSNSTLNQDKQYCITNNFIKSQFSDFDDDLWFSSSKNLPQIEHSTNWILLNWFIGANIYGFLNNLRWVTFDLWLRIQFLDSRQPHQSNTLFQFLTFHLGRIPWKWKNARIHRVCTFFKSYLFTQNVSCIDTRQHGPGCMVLLA